MDDRGIMLGVFLFEATLEARRSEWREQKREKKSLGDGGGASDFSKLKDRLKQ